MRLGTSLPELVAPLNLLYADFTIGDESEIPDFAVRLEPSSPVMGRLLGKARVLIDGVVAFDPFPRQQALPMFEWAVNWCVFTRPNQYLLLHSAVVERDGRALLLPGKPGTGKSTLTAGLIFGGWRLLSDEIGIVPPGTRRLLPLPRPVGLKDASIDIVRMLSPDATLGPASFGTRKGTVAHLRPPAGSVRRDKEPAEAHWIVFPQFEYGAGTEVRRISRPDALLRVGAEGFNYSILGAVGFETLAGLVEGCECYELRFGDLQQAIASVDDICEAATLPDDRAAAESVERLPGVEGPRGAAAAAAGGAGFSPPGDLLLDALRRPSSVIPLQPSEWGRLMGMARHARLLPRLGMVLEEEGLLARLSARVRELVTADRAVGEQHERIVRWEVGRIREALRGIDTKLVLLKGAAYVMAGLPAGRARLVTDVDVMVARSDLRRVEAALLAAGWEHVKLDPYDQRYYREWTHELPPLRHKRRQSVVDVHHTILPVTGRVRPNAAALLERAVPLPGDLWILSPADMLLHSAAHLFQDGDVAGGLRDLVDLDSLLRHFGQSEPAFWDELVPRAREHGLERSLYYALRYANAMLETPVPAGVHTEIASAAPPLPIRALMDRLVARALLPGRGDMDTSSKRGARLALYARSHWLRMPPGRLAAHLVRKASRQWFVRDEIH
jgi:HprK-related kinase A